MGYGGSLGEHSRGELVGSGRQHQLQDVQGRERQEEVAKHFGSKNFEFRISNFEFRIEAGQFFFNAKL